MVPIDSAVARAEEQIQPISLRELPGACFKNHPFHPKKRRLKQFSGLHGFHRPFRQF
jgi:hypothetical protein